MVSLILKQVKSKDWKWVIYDIVWSGVMLTIVIIAMVSCNSVCNPGLICGETVANYFLNVTNTTNLSIDLAINSTIVLP